MKQYVYRPIEINIMHYKISITNGGRRAYYRYDDGSLRRIKEVKNMRQYILLTMPDGNKILLFDKERWIVRNNKNETIGKSRRIIGDEEAERRRSINKSL